MSERTDNPPDSERVEQVPKGGGVHVFTPCHDAAVFVPAAQAVPGEKQRWLCPTCGQAWLVELVADDSAESGLRAVWTEADPGSTPGTGTDLEGDG